MLSLHKEERRAHFEHDINFLLAHVAPQPLDVRDGQVNRMSREGVNIGRTKSQLWVYPMSSHGTPFRLFEGDSVESDGQFSPDGRLIAYTSNQSGGREVYIAPFRVPPISQENNSAVANGRWQASLSGGQWPRWRRDGKELFYMALDNTLMAVPISKQGSSIVLGAAHPLFRTAPGNFYNISYVVSPNGRRFIINTAAPEKIAPITLVENWLSDFNK